MSCQAKALIDSGAGGLFINEDFAKSLRAPMQPLSIPIPVFNVDGTPNKRGVINKFVQVKVEVSEQPRNYTFLVTALGKQWVILGYPWLEEENPDINWRRQTIRWRTIERRNIRAMFKHKYPEEIDEPELILSYIARRPSDEEELTQIAASFIQDELTHESKDQPIFSLLDTSFKTSMTDPYIIDFPLSNVY